MQNSRLGRQSPPIPVHLDPGLGADLSVPFAWMRHPTKGVFALYKHSGLPSHSKPFFSISELLIRPNERPPPDCCVTSPKHGERLEMGPNISCASSALGLVLAQVGLSNGSPMLGQTLRDGRALDVACLAVNLRDSHVSHMLFRSWAVFWRGNVSQRHALGHT